MAEPKPSNLRTWAELGTATDPGDQKYKDGYGVEVPTHGDFNHLFKQQSQFNKHVNERGIPEWDAATAYEVGAFVSREGLLYQSLLTTTNNIPEDSPLEWGVWVRSNGKNFLINANFDIWQDGTVFTALNFEYAADQWAASRGTSTAGSVDVSRILVAPGDVSWNSKNPTYVAKLLGTGLSGGSTSAQFYQRIESVRTLSSSKATLSFTMDNNGGSSIVINPKITQNFGTGGSPSGSVVVGGSLNIPVGKSNYEVTLDIPSIAGKTIGTDGNDYIQVDLLNTAAGVNFDLFISSVQLQRGGQATAFEEKELGAILLECQRFFCFPSHANEFIFGSYVSGVINSWNFGFPTQMRAVPTLTINDAGYAYTRCANAVADAATHQGMRFYVTSNAVSGSCFIQSVDPGTIKANARL